MGAIRLKPPKNDEFNRYIEEIERIRNRTDLGENGLPGKFLISILYILY
jgi:hypothetical protein